MLLFVSSESISLKNQNCYNCYSFFIFMELYDRHHCFICSNITKTECGLIYLSRVRVFLSPSNFSGTKKQDWNCFVHSCLKSLDIIILSSVYVCCLS